MDGPAPAPSTESSLRTLALVGLSGPVLRFAEVIDGEAEGPRLRRLGAVDFAFDAEQAVLGEGNPAALDDVGEALRDVLAGTAAEALAIVAHPSVTTTFFTPLPVGLGEDAREVQLTQETALLADVAPTQAVRVRAVPVRTERAGGGERQWFHVVHVGEPVHNRLSRLADGLGVPGYDVVDATRAVAASLLATVEPAEGVDLVVGVYASHTEVVLCRGGDFLFANHGPGTTPADTAYFALAALQQAGFDIADAGRLFVYGDDATPDRLSLAAEFVGHDPTALDPFGIFRRAAQMPEAERASFAPVLGAAL